MLTWRQGLFVILVLAAGAFAVWWFFFRDADRRAVQKRFDTIIANVEKPVGEGNISMMAKHQFLSQCVGDTIGIKVNLSQQKGTLFEQEYSSTDALSHYATLRRLCKSIAISTRGVEITFPQSDLAHVTCYGTLRVTTQGNEVIEESRPVILAFRKKDGNWLLTNAEEHQVFH